MKSLLTSLSPNLRLYTTIAEKPTKKSSSKWLAAAGLTGIGLGLYLSRGNPGFKVGNPPNIDYGDMKDNRPVPRPGDVDSQDLAPWDTHESLKIATKHRENVQRLMQHRIAWSDHETARFFAYMEEKHGKDVQDKILHKDPQVLGDLQAFLSGMKKKLSLDQDAMTSLLFTQPGITLKDRDDYMEKYGCTKPTEEVVNVISALKVPILEVGAGSGHWAKKLRDAGVDIIATDSFSSHPTIATHSGQSSTMQSQPKGEVEQPITPEKLAQSLAILPYTDSVFPVMKLTASQALASFPGRSLLLVYPDGPPNPFARDALEQYTTNTTQPYFIYVGEPVGGVTATKDFFDYMANHWKVYKTIDVEPFAGGVERCWILQRK